MRLWRIVRREFADSAFSGEGSRLYAGRWNSPGTSVVYCAPSKTAAVLEFALHLGDAWRSLEQDYLLFRIDVPDEVSRERVRLESLPENWSQDRNLTQKTGAEWLAEQRTCVLKVPSLSVPGDAHFLINPAHPDFELLFVRPSQPWTDFTGYAEEDSDRFVAAGTPGWRRGTSAPGDLLANIHAKYGPKELFLCHAPEDRDSVVIPLRDELFQLGVSCWADFAEITVGDSIVQKINEGLTNAKFVLVIVSPPFLRHPRSQQQLNAALARESRQGRKIVLPLILNYADETVDFETKIPLVGDKHVYTWHGDARDAALEIERAIRSV